VIQIPVNDLPRAETSSVTGDPVRAFPLGMKMIGLITRKRFVRLRPDLPVSIVGASRKQ
jgi:hypothetical protein